MSILAAFMVPHPPMIVPQIGRGSEAQIQKTIDAYRKVAEEIAEIKPETILISSPHATMYADYFHISPGNGASGSFANFGAPKVSFTEAYDTELVGRMEILAQEREFPAGTLGQRDRMLDHGTMVPLYFIRQKYEAFKVIRIGLSGLSLAQHYAFGQLIVQAVEDTGRRVVYVASGDLSHKLQEYGPYGFAPEGPQYDDRIMDVCSRAAFEELFDFEESFCEKAAECGHRSFVIMAGALDGHAVEAKRLSHEDVTGVGYGICTFHVGPKADDRKFLERYLDRK
ncbi:MAG: AmmeMemoRadiSam system protein B, partial [Lachnospiraceae bacterium]|nr:AmmeMemoRadiSam system protein B [Lachnospiraceae bacterium]